MSGDGETQRIVIVGASYGGLAVATGLREAGFAGEVTLLTEEPGLPYHRTHLSKECLASELPPPRALHPESFFTDRQIDLRAGVRVVEIQRSRKTVRLADGLEYSYDRLVLATGAVSRKLPPEGNGEQVLTLRDAADGAALKAQLSSVRHMVVIGGGLIGLEVAASVHAAGRDVTVIEAAPCLMARSVYPVVSERVSALHRAAGIDIRLSVNVADVIGNYVTLADGSTVAADLVFAAIGSAPRIELAVQAGLACQNGIATDVNGRTSDSSIYALGDCALWDHAGEAHRHESIAAAQAQGAIVAAALARQPRQQPGPLRLWSMQGQLRVQMSGPVMPNAEITSEEIDGGGLVVRAWKKDRVVAVQAINAPRQFNAALRDLERMEEIAQA